MHSRFHFTNLNAFLALIAIVAITLLITQFAASHSTAQAQEAPPPQQAQITTQWEYKVLALGPGATKKFNEQIPELQWEFVTSSDGWTLFRRPIRVIQGSE